jgi:hypothetical protein
VPLFLLLARSTVPLFLRHEGAKELATMAKGSYLLNLSRGNVVDVDALAASLKVSKPLCRVAH